MSKYINAEPMICDDCFHNTVCRLDGNEMLEWCSAKVPSADVADIVRCKDCKYWEYKCQGDFDYTYGDCLFWQIEHCSEFYMETTGNHYCGFAKERKDNDK